MGLSYWRNVGDWVCTMWKKRKRAGEFSTLSYDVIHDDRNFNSSTACHWSVITSPEVGFDCVRVGTFTESQS
jgi:hypothetical protein